MELNPQDIVSYLKRGRAYFDKAHLYISNGIPQSEAINLLKLALAVFGKIKMQQKSTKNTAPEEG